MASLSCIANRIGQQMCGKMLRGVAGNFNDRLGAALSSTEVTIFSFCGSPPFIAQDAVTVGVGTGKKRGVPGGGYGVGIVVIAIGEVGAVIEQREAKAIVTPN